MYIYVEGKITLRNGWTEEKALEDLRKSKSFTEKFIEDALSMMLDIDVDVVDEIGTEILDTFSLDGTTEYREEDFTMLAKYFDGEINCETQEVDSETFVIYLKDGKVKRSDIEEIIPKADETIEKALIQRLVELGTNPRDILEAFPNFVAAKIWTDEDILRKMDEMDIPEEKAERLLPDVKDQIFSGHYYHALEECDDSEWNSIQNAIKDVLKREDVA